MSAARWAATFLARLLAIAALLWVVDVVSTWIEVRADVASCEAGPYGAQVVYPGEPVPVYEATLGEGLAPVTVTDVTVYCSGDGVVFPVG